MIDILLAIGSPFIVGMVLLVALLGGLMVIGAPLELTALIMVIFIMTTVSFFIPPLLPIIAIVCGLVIGMMFLRLVRR